MVFWHHSDIPDLAGVCVVYSEVSYVRYLCCHVQEYSQYILQILHRLSHLYHRLRNGILLSLTKPGKLFCAMLHEPPHDKTNKMACAPSEDSDQPGHPPRLIRVFAVRMKKAWVFSYPLSGQRILIRLGK